MTFKAALQNAMKALNLNQRQVSGITGCSTAAISQYLSGKNVPPEEKQREMAEAMGLDSDYFRREIRRTNTSIRRGQMRKMCPEEAAKLMGVGREAVRCGLQQGVFPWGYAVRMKSGKWVYMINADRFAEIEGINAE